MEPDEDSPTPKNGISISAEVGRAELLGGGGFSIREIARRTGHDPKTVRKYLRHPEAPRYCPRPPERSNLDPYKE